MGGDDLSVGGGESELYSSIALDTISAVMDALMDSEKSLVEAEFKRVINDPDVSKHIKETLPYLYAGAFLSLSGREINSDNMTKVLSAVGIVPDNNIESLLVKTGLRTHLPYLYAYYFLLALGKESTEEDILDVVDSVGIAADKARIKEVFSFFTSKEKLRDGA